METLVEAFDNLKVAEVPSPSSKHLQFFFLLAPKNLNLHLMGTRIILKYPNLAFVDTNFSSSSNHDIRFGWNTEKNTTSVRDCIECVLLGKHVILACSLFSVDYFQKQITKSFPDLDITFRIIIPKDVDMTVEKTWEAISLEKTINPKLTEVLKSVNHVEIWNSYESMDDIIAGLEPTFGGLTSFIAPAHALIVQLREIVIIDGNAYHITLNYEKSGHLKVRLPDLAVPTHSLSGHCVSYKIIGSSNPEKVKIGDEGSVIVFDKSTTNHITIKVPTNVAPSYSRDITAKIHENSSDEFDIKINMKDKKETIQIDLRLQITNRFPETIFMPIARTCSHSDR